MEEKKMNEQESLELIAQMIRNSKQNMEVGRGNIMLFWGYLTVLVSLVVYGGLVLTHHPGWNMAWFVIPVFGYPIMLWMDRKRRHKARVKTYIDNVMDAIWCTAGIAMMGATAFFCFSARSVILLPFSLIFIAMATATTLMVLKERALSVLCMVGLGIGMALLAELFANNRLTVVSILYFIVGFVITLIVPGHILNRKV